MMGLLIHSELGMVVAGFMHLWSAAIHRRFLCVATLDGGPRLSAESGDKSPHSKGTRFYTIAGGQFRDNSGDTILISLNAFRVAGIMGAW
jgi:hypothetical protein